MAMLQKPHHILKLYKPFSNPPCPLFSFLFHIGSVENLFLNLNADPLYALFFFLFFIGLICSFFTFFHHIYHKSFELFFYLLCHLFSVDPCLSLSSVRTYPLYLCFAFFRTTTRKIYSIHTQEYSSSQPIYHQHAPSPKQNDLFWIDTVGCNRTLSSPTALSHESLFFQTPSSPKFFSSSFHINITPSLPYSRF